MSSTTQSNNWREIISAQSDVTARQEYLTSHNGALNVNGNFSITGGATAANQTNGNQKTQIVDSDGNSIDSLPADTGVNSLLVGIGPTNYVLSTNNSSTAQLTAGATFTGVIESCFNEPEASVLLTVDQNSTLTINQYIDAAGSFVVSSWIYPILAGVAFSRSFVINGNYINFVLKNDSITTTTTTLNLNVAYGTIPAATNLGNAPIALSEINGTTVAAGSGVITAGTQRVVISSDQVMNLPTGAATAAKQDTGNSSLNSVDTKLNSQATAAKQDTSNISLSSIDTKLATSNTNTDSAATSLDIMDDWDENNRAKTNPVVGQDGVAAGSGITTGNTQRMILATDQPSVPVTGALTDTQLRASAVPVSASTLPLPSGAATGTKQDTGNTSLSSIDSKLSGTLSVSDVASAILIAFTTTVTAAGTRVQLATNGSDAGVIQADPDNPDGSYVYVGGSSVSSSAWGAKLAPGGSVGVSISNTNKIWIDASSNGLKAGFLGS